MWAKRLIWLPGLLRLVVSNRLYEAKGVRIGRYSILDGTKVRGKGARLTLGHHSYVARDVVLALHERIYIGNGVVINSGVKILTGTHAIHSEWWEQENKPVRIEDFAWIAMNAIILPGVTVGRGAVVGAGAVVRRDIEPYEVVIGNPAERVSLRRCKTFKYSPVGQNAIYEAWLGSFDHRVEEGGA